MKHLLIPCMVLILSASCTNQLAEDINEQVEATTQYINIEAGLKAGHYLIDLSTYCDDLTIPADLSKRITDNPNDIDAIIKAMQILEQQDVFGDTLAEDETYYDTWTSFCLTNNITLYYDCN